MINKRTLKDRAKELLKNSWLSKLLFQELPLSTPTNLSQLYVLQVNEREDGVQYVPIRATLESILSMNLNSHDEGNAFTVYLPSEIYDEGEASTTYLPEEIQDEANASAVY